MVLGMVFYFKVIELVMLKIVFELGVSNVILKVFGIKFGRNGLRRSLGC